MLGNVDAVPECERERTWQTVSPSVSGRLADVAELRTGPGAVRAGAAGTAHTPVSRAATAVLSEPGKYM